ncbi:Spo0E family sporulation regulatory protein-aspartic acid phosphatase [Pseudalkalibacillus sp. SCS-8]|uniref:Spo0E family sporulation regulatory protein-aspartic acid phosphatase n=1 Tax=Pseudalkalibacillus nanhaiensis TaxID=3115291 RepID=UPI0032DB4473
MTKSSLLDIKDEVYMLQKLMYEQSKQLDNFSDPAIVKISQLLDEKLNIIQKAQVKN